MRACAGAQSDGAARPDSRVPGRGVRCAHADAVPCVQAQRGLAADGRRLPRRERAAARRPQPQRRPLRLGRVAAQCSRACCSHCCCTCTQQERCAREAAAKAARARGGAGAPERVQHLVGRARARVCAQRHDGPPPRALDRRRPLCRLAHAPPAPASTTPSSPFRFSRNCFFWFFFCNRNCHCCWNNNKCCFHFWIFIKCF